MRGSDERTGELFSYVDIEERVPRNHPLRLIRRIVNDVLAALVGEFPLLLVLGLEGEVRSGDVDSLFLPITALRKDPYPSQAQDEDDQEFEKGSFQANFIFS